MKNLLFIFLLWIASLCGYAQQKCSFTHYSSEDGLSQNTVMSMLQDHKGIMWFATWDGINKFNGYSFKTFKARQGDLISLTNNRVDRMVEDIYGYIWVLTYDNRAHRFDPNTETFIKVPSSGEGSTANILSIEAMKDGSVWLLTENEGAIRVLTDLNTHQLTTDVYSLKAGLFPAQKVYKVHLSASGNEWMLTDNGLGLIRPGQKMPVSYFVETNGNRHRHKQSFYSLQETPTEIFFGSDMGRVWSYQKKRRNFQLLELPTKSNVISVNSVSPDEIVFSTADDGFFTYRLGNKEIIHYNTTTCVNLPSNKIVSVYVDRCKEVWFELKEADGVTHFNPHTNKVKQEIVPAEQGGASRSRPAFHIHEDVNGYLWVHPYGGGMSYFDRKLNKIVPFYNEFGSSNWRFSNKLHSAMSDRQGNLWMCTHSRGLEKITFQDSQFHLTTPDPHDYESLSNETRAIFEDKSRNLWVALKDGTLRIYDSNRNYMGYLTESGVISQSGAKFDGVVYSITQDRKGVIWIGTKGRGLVRAEKAGNQYHLSRFIYNEDDIYSLSDDNIYCVFEDHKGKIWIATFGGGINYIDQDKNGHSIFINHRNNLKGYPIDQCYRVRYITEDAKGYIWVGTTSGVLSFKDSFANPEEIQFNHYSRVPSSTTSLSNNDVHWIHATKSGELYLATFGGGLNKLLYVSGKDKAVFKCYTVKDGAPSDVMLSMQEDVKGNLWISTENGLSKFIPSQHKFENYDDKSFSFKASFSEGTSEITANHEIYFGTTTGFLYFNPMAIRKSTYVPYITFSELMIANKEVGPGVNSVLKVGLDDTKELTLSHKENTVTIQYSALDFRNADNIKYAYYLEGFDKEWTYVDKQRSATYTNLPKGDYVFHVKSTNSDGVWVNNERCLKINVLPSFWETSWAYLIYFVFILGIILVAVFILFTIYRLKNEVSVEQQVSDIKLRFFTNISHELRTPLTLISGPVEQVLKNSQIPEDAREQLNLVKRNTDRMLRLVNQILDFRKIQNKKMKMQVQEINTVPFVRRIMDNFESLAENHRIEFLFENEDSQMNLWVDIDKFEKILFNLLSNAFKFTPQGKMIKVFIKDEGTTLAIGVSDQGIGIADSKKNSLFTRFENLVDRNLFNQPSTGIGLSLVKELVEMHKATIQVDSKLGEGSCFTTHFLKGKDHYDESVELILSDTDYLEKNEVLHSVDFSDETQLKETDTCDQNIDLSKETMLLIEDNAELRYFLRSIFSSTYQVIEASDGKDGYEKALKYVPDMIISDVMMPEKDGIELTKELKTEMATSHIPIVLLSAKSDIESKLQGLEFGADDYITKPFSATYLEARVENLLAQRHKLQELYRANLMAKPKEESPVQPEMSLFDRRFMDKLLSLMEKNMDNGDLIVDDLVQEMAVSRSVFFKKLKMLTGLAPIEFIKEMRVKRAAELIKTGEYNMTQISYMVGINDPRYFSKCFKQKYGMTPTEYKESIGKNY